MHIQTQYTESQVVNDHFERLCPDERPQGETDGAGEGYADCEGAAGEHRQQETQRDGQEETQRL
ncbi:hypothetical protein E2C01_025367 [Portunus trituberculatus]|uniref:Uncharacterized protein n=1 Tax=Portunus trituberculatus TaxID=210409 RepID=A0A5B7EHR1_PORTR|nr:hypothetical protein [Portunus trituberculatus]